MSDTVKIFISQDPESGEYQYVRVTADNPHTEWVFEVPEETFVQWETTRRQREIITNTLEELHQNRRRVNDVRAERDRLAAELRAAEAAYAAFLAETARDNRNIPLSPETRRSFRGDSPRHP